MSGRGGYRPGAGRKVGSTKKVLNEERRRAALSGDLPHQFLLKVMRGEVINGEKPSMTMRIDAAKAAAPFYAPKLATVEVMQSLTDDDLDFIIKNAAAEAGISLGTGGESKESESTPRPRTALAPIVH